MDSLCRGVYQGETVTIVCPLGVHKMLIWDRRGELRIVDLDKVKTTYWSKQ